MALYEPSTNTKDNTPFKAAIGDSAAPKVFYFESIDSTNSEAKRAVLGGIEADAVFVADGQTGGRGRSGKSFYSPSGDGLYLSIVLSPDATLFEATAITPLTAVIVTEVLGELTSKQPQIKWVNDIFIDGKKVCGILTEAIFDHEQDKISAVIVGVGINLTTTEFPTEIEGIAGSVGNIDRYILTAEIFKRLKKACDKINTRDFMERYRKYSLVIGKEISFSKNGVDYCGIAKSILDDGSLSVSTKDGEMLLSSGEISIKLS